MRHRTWFLSLTLALCAPGSALAQSTDAHARADESFRQGREALAKGDDALALRLFRASQELEPGRGKLLNIALCEDKLGQLTAATRHFEEVLQQLPSVDDRREIVRQHLTELEHRTPHLQIRLTTGAPSAAKVTYDGAPLAQSALGADMTADPGKHVVVVNAPDRSERRFDVVLEEGKTVALSVAVGAAVGVVGKPRIVERIVAPQAMSSRWKTGFIAGGVGVAGLAVGGVTGILALVHRGAIESQCPSHRGCSPEIVDHASSGKSLSIASTVAFAAGAVGIGAGVYLVLSRGKSAGAPKVGLTLLSDGERVGIGGVF